MPRQQFTEASENFQMWLNALNAATENFLPQARKLLEETSPKAMGGSREQDAELVLRSISERIDDIMSSFDRMLQSIGTGPRYGRFFKL